MATIKRFEDLEIWQLARQLCIKVEALVNEGLTSRNPRLKDQIQGSTGSVMDNIAEGFEKENTKELIHYLYHSKGSCGEARSQLIRIMDFKYFDADRIKELIRKAEIISVQIKMFIGYLYKTKHKGQRYAEEPAVLYAGLPEYDFFDLITECQNYVHQIFKSHQINQMNEIVSNYYKLNDEA